MSLKEAAFEIRKSLGCTLVEAERVLRHRIGDKKVFQAVTLLDRYPRTFSLYPVKDYWYLDRGARTDFCDLSGHEPDCIRFSANWAYGSSGYWLLKTPISISGSMPGTEHELSYVSLESGIWIDPWTYGITNYARHLKVMADGDLIWSVEREKILQGDGSFLKNEYTDIARSIEGYDTLQVELYNAMSCLTGGFSTHFLKILFTVLYAPTTPPEPATVKIRVYNRQTGTAVKSAYVALMSGDRVIADGYTVADGWITFENVPGGFTGISYTLLVLADGYHEYKESKDIVPGTNTFQIPLAPIPKEPIPDWVWWGVAAALGIGAVVTVPRLIPKKEERPYPPIYVVK